LRSLIREHKPAILAALAHRNPSAVPPNSRPACPPRTWRTSRPGTSPLGTVQAIEAAAVAREAEDLKEFFGERSAILEHDAGLPRADAEAEVTRIGATYVRNRGYL
jgi:hypothetical protein